MGERDSGSRLPPGIRKCHQMVMRILGSSRDLHVPHALGFVRADRRNRLCRILASSRDQHRKARSAEWADSPTGSIGSITYQAAGLGSSSVIGFMPSVRGSADVCGWGERLMSGPVGCGSRRWASSPRPPSSRESVPRRAHGHASAFGRVDPTPDRHGASRWPRNQPLPHCTGRGPPRRARDQLVGLGIPALMAVESESRTTRLT